MKIIFNLLKITFLILLIVGCSNKKAQEHKVDQTAESMLKIGKHDIVKSNYKEAIDNFEQLERNFPVSPLVAEALILKAYSYYSEAKFEDAILVVEDFLKQYPSHPNIDYMYYIKSICYYDQILDVGRDQEITHKALNALNEVIEYFPDSKYARDAKWKADYAFNSLAGKEMYIGRFYLKTSNVVAALGRFKMVIDLYQTSIFTPEALFRLTDIYYSMGAFDEAKKYAAVLGYNYPKSTWYKMAYETLNHRGKKKVGLIRNFMNAIY